MLRSVVSNPSNSSCPLDEKSSFTTTSKRGGNPWTLWGLHWTPFALSPESPQNPDRLASFSGSKRFWGCRCGVQALGRGAVMLPDSFLKGDHFPRQQQCSPQLLKMALNTHQQPQQAQGTHDDAAIHVCWDCNARFTRPAHLKRHIISQHLSAASGMSPGREFSSWARKEAAEALGQ